MQVLTALQCSRLIVGNCNPFVVDCIELCRLLEAQWQQQWGSTGAGDRGHLLAASAAGAVPLCH